MIAGRRQSSIISAKQLLFLSLVTLSLYETINALSSPSPQVKRIIQNLVSISTHLQNPDLYSPAWANNVSIVTSSNRKKKNAENENEDYSLIASKDVKQGELLTLYPVNAVGIKSRSDNNDIVDDHDDISEIKEIQYSMGMKKYTKKKTKKQQIKKNKERFLESYEYLYHDSKWNLDDIIPVLKPHQHEVELGLLSLLSSSNPSISLLGVSDILKGHENEVFVQSHPSRKLFPGWYGHLIKTESYLVSNKSKGMQKMDVRNCQLVPLPYAIPLCGIVATRDIDKGEEIIRHIRGQDPKEVDTTLNLIKKVVENYSPEISELGSYVQMAYNEVQDESNDSVQENKSIQLPTSSFHAIDESYPNVKKLHSNPDIYMVPDFLTSDECDRLTKKSSPHLMPCLVKTQESGSVHLDPNIRTSTNANIPRAEVPSITEKITKLINCSEEQLEIYQVLKYERGQEFKPHTDGFDKPTTACGFFQSGRIATLFTYLNDVEKGGKTIFSKIDVEITPKKGTAIVHFPMTLDLIEDERTEHEGSVAIDNKWIMSTWVWKDERLDARYSERNLQSLSDDTI